MVVTKLKPFCAIAGKLNCLWQAVRGIQPVVSARYNITGRHRNEKKARLFFPSMHTRGLFNTLHILVLLQLINGMQATLVGNIWRLDNTNGRVTSRELKSVAYVTRGKLILCSSDVFYGTGECMAVKENLSMRNIKSKF